MLLTNCIVVVVVVVVVVVQILMAHKTKRNKDSKNPLIQTANVKSFTLGGFDRMRLYTKDSQNIRP